MGGKRPELIAPPGACDCHVHVFEPHFASPPKAGTPLASAAMYRQVQAALGLQRVVFVQANAYGDDNRGMLLAMASFGDNARGVAVVMPDIGEAQLKALTDQGVRGVRFHLLPGGTLGWDQLDTVVARVGPLGWHVQIQLNGCELPLHEARLRALPVPLVIDHLGKFIDPGPPAVDGAAFRSLQRLLDGGRCWVKLSAPYESSRSGPPDCADVAPLALALVASFPERCVWVSNWPHPGRSPQPDSALMLDQLLHWAGDERARQHILVDNPAQLYGFARAGATAA